MLALPTKGFGVSVEAHNVDIDALAEWIEGCVTFDDERVSESDIIDILTEENIYRDQGFAKQRLDDGLLELDRRQRCLGKVCPYAVEARHVKRVRAWQETPAYSFCLMLGLQVSYREQIKKISTDFSEQGILFEQLTTESLGRIGWRTHATAWSKAASNSIRDKVEALALHLGERSRPDDIGRWTSDSAKDGGLDVVCHWPFSDGWSGRPLFYVQCASGEHWKQKRSTPNLALWDKLLDLATKPKRGLSIPFALLSDDFRKDANFDDLALLLDRQRVCSPIEGLEPGWVSASLAKQLNTWTETRMKALVTAKVN